MSINHLYSIWHSRIWQLRPQEYIARVRNQGWLITAIFYGRAVQWGPIADADQGEKPDSYLGVYYHQSLAVILMKLRLKPTSVGIETHRRIWRELAAGVC